jgi:hypothetical protein
VEFSKVFVGSFVVEGTNNQKLEKFYAVEHYLNYPYVKFNNNLGHVL